MTTAQPQFCKMTNQTTMQDKSLLEKHFQTLLLSVITAVVIALFGFLWNVNKELAIMQERDISKNESIKELKDQLTTLNNNFLDFKEKIREEFRQNRQK